MFFSLNFYFWIGIFIKLKNNNSNKIYKRKTKIKYNSYWTTPTWAARMTRSFNLNPRFVQTFTVPDCLPGIGTRNMASCTFGSNFSPSAGSIRARLLRSKIFNRHFSVMTRPLYIEVSFSSTSFGDSCCWAAESFDGSVLTTARFKMSATSRRSLQKPWIPKVLASSIPYNNYHQQSIT